MGIMTFTDMVFVILQGLDHIYRSLSLQSNGLKIAKIHPEMRYATYLVIGKTARMCSLYEKMKITFY